MFSTGDLVPYSQLAPAVAGQGARQVMGDYQQGGIDKATLEDALNKATMGDLQTKVAMQDAPSAAILKNIKDAQSINAPIPEASSDDIGKARDEIMSGDDSAPDPVQTHQIMARAKEMAMERAPKLDPMDPSGYLMQQTNPLSNKDMDLLRYQELYKGRMGVADLNNQSRQSIAADKLDWDKEKLGVTEAGKNSRTDTMAGAVSGTGAPNLKVQKVGLQMVKEFNQSTAGQLLNSNSTMLSNPNNEGFISQAVSHYNQLIRTGNIPDAMDFYQANSKKLSALGHPLNPPPALPKPKVKVPPPTPSAEVPPPDDNAVAATDMSQLPIGAPAPANPQADALARMPASQPQGNGRNVVNIGGTAYGVGDIVKIRGVKFRINPDGSGTKVNE